MEIRPAYGRARDADNRIQSAANLWDVNLIHADQVKLAFQLNCFHLSLRIGGYSEMNIGAN
jgi:hypothetical protein